MDRPVSGMDAFLRAHSDSEVDTLIRLLDAIRAGLSVPTPSRRKA
jgi:hypothetical protein